jgi:hypothetical protein
VSFPTNDGFPADHGDDAGVLPAIDDILRSLAGAVTREGRKFLGNRADTILHTKPR